MSWVGGVSTRLVSESTPGVVIGYFLLVNANEFLCLNIILAARID